MIDLKAGFYNIPFENELSCDSIFALYHRKFNGFGCLWVSPRHPLTFSIILDRNGSGVS